MSESTICRLTVQDGTQLAYHRQGTEPTIVLSTAVSWITEPGPV